MAVAEIVAAASRRTDDDLLILVVVSPERLSRIAAAIDVIAEYAPACRVWMYDASSRTPLREVTREDLGTWEARDAEQDGPPIVHLSESGLTTSEPKLKLVDDRPDQARPDRGGQSPEGLGGQSTGSSDEERNKPPILTDDELSILLGDDDVDDDDGDR
jgi:hypothetical protein